MAWTNEKSAHVDTWIGLLKLKQLNVAFPDAGSLKMSELTFFNPTASKDLLRIEATLMANTIDQIFTAFGVKLEGNVSRNAALGAMVEALMDESKTVEQLADVNDVHYLFINEKKTTS